METTTKALIRELAGKHAPKVVFEAELGSAEADIIEGNAAIAITLACESLLRDLGLADTCKGCKAPMNSVMRVHHHTENGVDVTQQSQAI